MSDFGTPPPPSFPSFPTPPLPPGRTGPPWESPQGAPVQRWIDTAKGVLTDPVATFANMRREGGLGAPLIYYLIGMLVGMAGTILWQMIGIGGGMFGGGHDPGLLFLIICIPILATIGMFVGSFIIHFALGLFGGQKHPYETTFRVMAYAFGSSQPIALIPFCGSPIAGLWGLVVAILGLAQAQETSTGKSAAAVLTPSVLCCGLFFMFGAMILTMIGLGAMSR